MKSAKIVRNTATLFTRQILTLAISLYAIRALLAELGVNDFALFNALFSVVMLGSFLPAALGMITQRYFAFEIGKGDQAGLKKAHDASLFLCLGMCLLILIALETIGAWFVSTRLVVEPDRLESAKLLFHLMVLSFTLANLTGFYTAVAMAHEDMYIVAWLSILDAILRLAAVLALGFLQGDVLVSYGVMLSASALSVLVLYHQICRRRYAECRSWPRWPGGRLLREMLGFSGWTIFGQFTTVCRIQAVTLLINQAFSPATMAARAISVSVTTQVLSFSNNFTAALNPPIIKSYAAKEHEETFRLISLGAKISFFFVWFATLPMLALTPGLLTLWLSDYPGETILFVRLGLLENAILAISAPLMSVVRATGRVRLYEIVLGFLQLIVLLGSWLAVSAGYPAYWIYLIAIAINLVMFGARLWIVGRLTGLPVGAFLKQAGLPCLMVLLLSSASAWGIYEIFPGMRYLKAEFSSLSAALLLCCLTPLSVYSIGLSRAERSKMQQMIRKRLIK